MKFWLGLFVSVSLSGCGEDSQIKDAVSERLRDPDSAKFGDLVISQAGDRACIEYNAKNGFGGYGPGSVAELYKMNDVWQVREMDVHPYQCTEIEFKADVAGLKASRAASDKAFEMLTDLGKFSSEDEKFEAQRGSGPCGNLIEEFGMYAGAVAETKVKGGDVASAEKDLAVVLQKVQTGDCAAPSLNDLKMEGKFLQ